MTSETPAKLPVWETAVECYRLTFRHLGDLLRFSWPWLLLLIALSGALYWALYPTELASMNATGTGSNVLWLSSLLLTIAIGAAIAVPWHRLLLLGEVQGRSNASMFDQRKVKYFLLSMAVFVALLTPLYVAINFLPNSSSDDNIAADALIAVSFIAALIGAIAVINRLSLVLPACALDHAGFGWGKSWGSTRGSTSRLLAISLLVLVPTLAISIGTSSFFSSEIGDSANPVTQAAFAGANVITELLGVLLGVFEVTFLSLAYRHFTGLAAPESTSATRPAP